MDLAIGQQLVATVRGIGALRLRGRSKQGKTMEVAVVEMVPTKSRGEGNASSLSKSKGKMTEFSVEESLKKKLLASAPKNRGVVLL